VYFASLAPRPSNTREVNWGWQGGRAA
jgi:hypothetical protein